MGTCSSALTKPCIGLTDPRYDPNVSNNLVDQDALWKQYAGSWGPFVERRNTLSDNNAPRKPTFYNPKEMTGMPYQSDVFTSFRVTTIDGSRIISHKIYFYKPAPAEFCNQTVPDGMQNTIENEVCGEHGLVQVIEEFGTSTFEKDGTANITWVNVGPKSDETSGFTSQETRMSTVDDNAVFTYVERPGVFAYTLTETFYGDDQDYLIAVGSGATIDDPNLLRQAASSSGSKIDGQENIFPALEKAYNDHSIPVPEWVKNGKLPDCLAEPWGSCPTENDWCSQNDPSCSTSIYQEPAASLNGGGIALVVVLSLLVVFSGVYFFKRYLEEKQRKRYMVHFASIAVERLGHVGHLAQLDPKELEDEFKKMDAGLKSKDGMIDKEALWTWVQSGKAGTMEKKDFDALFTTMDIDGDGEVSFLEFCGFMARCGSEYDREVEDQLLAQRGRRRSTFRGTIIGTLGHANDHPMGDEMHEIAELVAAKKIE